MDGEPRVGMLETIREYGRERLQERGELAVGHNGMLPITWPWPATARLAIGTPPPVDVVSSIRTLAAARRALGLRAAPPESSPAAEASVSVWGEGQVLLLEQAIAATLAEGGAA
jgi:hypothetical protein